MRTIMMFRSLFIVALISVVVDRGYCDTNYRLNTTIKPKAYSIAITPYFDTGDALAFTFDGEVNVTFITEEPINQIKLHSEDLIFDASNITVANGSDIFNLNTASPVEFNKNYTFAYINLETDLQVDIEYTLKISYRGPIREDLQGFYRNYYIEKGVKKWLGATQMESTHARKVFPCFDEPEFKATFTLIIDRPENYSLSRTNTKLQHTVPLSNGYIREIFHPTPIMSTYLVAFLVSEFKGVQNIFNGTTNEFGIFTRPEAVNQTKYALDFGMRVVTALGKFFGIDYYSTNANLKLDHVGLPGYQNGAMENWGLVIYREEILLYESETSSPLNKYYVARAMAHETTHMWFGDLVTCHWWSNIWLNEGFATYFMHYITSLIEPEFTSSNSLVTETLWSAYDADEDTGAHAITYEVYSPDDISAQFSHYSYEKAGSVIRMMHHLIGDEAFKLGLHTYLEANKLGLGYPNKLYEALDLGARNFSSMVAYNTDVAEVMSSWITQPGHPILHVDVNYENSTVTLTQKRFYIESNHSSNAIYHIPVTFTTENTSDFANTKPAFIMTNTSHTLTIDGLDQDHSWVLFNIQETGLYRVNYDDQSWRNIASALRGANKDKIHHLNRAKIVNDLFALFYSDEVKFDRVKSVLEFLMEEDNYSVWYAAVRGFKQLYKRYFGSDAMNEVQAYILEYLNSAIGRLGYDEDITMDSFEKACNRKQILEFACKLGHKGCVDHAVKLFRGLRENRTEISPSLRPVAYCTGLRHGNGSDYDFLWNRMATTNVASEARVIGEILGCTSDEGKLRSYLLSMLVENSPIMFPDLYVPLTSVLSHYHNWHIVLDELKKNYTLWTSIYKTDKSVLPRIADVLRTEEDFSEFEAFLTSCSKCTKEAKSSASGTLKLVKKATNWANQHKSDILSSLNSRGTIIF